MRPTYSTNSKTTSKGKYMLSVTKTLTPHRLVEKIWYTVGSNKELDFFGAFSQIGDTTISDGIPTACTDGLNTTFNGEFMMSLPFKQCIFVALHEIFHIAYKHPFMYRDLFEIDPTLANLACDYWNNQQLIEFDPQCNILEVPCRPDGTQFICYDKKFTGFSIRQIFKYLQEENVRNEQPKPNAAGEGTGEANTEPSDDKLEGYSQAIIDRVGEQFDEHEFEKLFADATLEEVQAAEEMIDAAIQVASRIHGKDLTGGMKRGLVEVINTEVDWRTHLQEFMVESKKDVEYSSYRRFNRRMQAQEIYMPSATGNAAGEWVLAIDTSCSRDDRILSLTCHKFVDMCHTIRPSKVHVIYWDAEICSVETYGEDEYDTILDLTNPVGGGGTDPDCVLRHIEENIADNTYDNNIDGIIMFSDGYFYHPSKDWKALNIPVLWAIDDNGSQSVEVPCGTIIYIKD